MNIHLGYALLRDPRVAVRSKLIALTVGLAITGLVELLQLPFESVFALLAPVAGAAGDKSLIAEPDAVSFLMDADRHLKAIALAGVSNLAKKTHVEGGIGVTDLRGNGDISKFINFARNGKVWERDTE